MVGNKVHYMSYQILFIRCFCIAITALTLTGCVTETHPPRYVLTEAANNAFIYDQNRGTVWKWNQENDEWDPTKFGVDSSEPAIVWLDPLSAEVALRQLIENDGSGFQVNGIPPGYNLDVKASVEARKEYERWLNKQKWLITK